MYEIVEYIPTEGSNFPPLLFVHGAWHGAWCWTENFLPYFFDKGFACYALSLRGHGGSAGIEKLHSFSLNDYKDDVIEVMKYLKEKPVLIGHSMGGAVVQKVVHAHPDSVKMAVLLASIPPQGVSKDLPRIYLTRFRERFETLLFNRQRKSVHPLSQLLFSGNLTDEEKNKFTKLLQPESRRAIGDLLKRVVPVPKYSLWTSLTGKRPQDNDRPLQVPMLVLGSKKDAMFSEKTVQRTAKAYQTQPIIFPDLCHDMMLDPEWRSVADSIDTFLRETLSAEGKGR
jgi:pimeloyl-ACP methyl ester carboxylesterase